MADLGLQALTAALRKGRGVVLQSYPSLSVLSAVQALVGEVASHGANVVLLVDATSQSEREALDAQWGIFLSEAYAAEPFNQGASLLCTVSEFTDLLRDPEHTAWLNRVGLILIPRGEQILSRPYAWELMAYALRDRCAELGISSLPRTLVLIERRRSPEPAIRDALPIYATADHAERHAWSEFTAPAPEARQLWWTVWTTEANRAYFDGLLSGNNGACAGISPPLAQFAGRWGVAAVDNKLVYTSDSGDLDHIEALQDNLSTLLFKAEPTAPWVGLLEASQLVGAVTISESQGNPWRLLRRVAHSYTDTAICNLITRSTLLLPYLVANAGYFAGAPLKPLSPLVSREVPLDTAVQLIQRIHVAGELPLRAVQDALRATAHPRAMTDPALIDTFGALVELIREQLGDALGNRLRLAVNPKWVSESGCFVSTAYVSLAPSKLSDAGIEWLDEFDVKNEAGNLFYRLRRDHVDQRFWKGKVVVFDAKKYSVDQLDHATRTITISPNDRATLPDYRPERLVTITTPRESWVATQESFEETNANGEIASCEGFRLQFSVRGSRVVTSSEHWSTPAIVEKVIVSERSYKAGRAVRLSLRDGKGASQLTAAAAVALAAWINEAAVTLLPEVATFVLAAPQVAPDARPTDLISSIVVPTLHLPQSEEAAIPCVWVFEDSNSDLGIARALADGRWYLLDVCHDWLNWYLNEAEVPVCEPHCLDNAVRPPRDWFSFGGASRDAAIGLSDLRDALSHHSARFDEVSPRRKQLVGESLLQGAAVADEVVCDICQTTISNGTPHDTLSDGRISCKACAAVGVNKVRQLEQLYREVAVPFFNKAHGITDIANVSVDLVDQCDIAETQGRKYIPTSGFDRRAIGIAISQGGSLRVRSATETGTNYHRILIESGFSAESTASTLVHELCHIWQFNNLDYEHMSRDHGKYLIEGHAMWTEDSFLTAQRTNIHPLFDSARLADAISGHEVLKGSGNEYGGGYRLLVAKLNPFERSAFQWLRKHYPKR